MKHFYETYKDADEKLSALLRQTSWTNNLTIMSRSKSAEERLFYLHLCIHDRLSTRQLDREQNPMTMADWVAALDDQILRLRKNILASTGAY